MRSSKYRLFTALAVVGFWGGLQGLALANDRAGATVHWPQFRGPNASGVAQGPAPTRWNGEDGTNIKWKTAIPGLGHSSPVIWGDRVFVTTAISGKSDPVLRVGLYGDIQPVLDDTEHSFRVIALDKKSGKVLWEHEAYKGVPKVKRHTKATHANCTPATDGKHLVAFFGSEGLYCYDMDGELRWKKDLGTLDSGYFVVPDAQWEFASSPIIHKNMVIVQCDIQKDSFVAAFDIGDGREIWRTPRNEVPTWSTPTIQEGPDRTQIIVNGFKHIGGYDVRTGKEIWRMTGGGDIPVPTPVLWNDLAFITNAHGPAAPIYAIRTSATGDISLSGDATSNDHVAWANLRIGNYMQTLLVYDDLLYACRDNGIQACYEPLTGKNVYRQRLGSGSSGFTASPVAADGKLYYSSEEGDIYVVQAGREQEVIATNPMGEVVMATPAISEGKLYIRGQSHLFCIGK